MKKLFVISVIVLIGTVLFAIGLNWPTTTFAPEENPDYIYNVEETALNIREADTRDATIKIFSPSGGHGSGTLYFHKNKTIILTAGHIVKEDGYYILMDSWGEQKLGVPIYIDPTHDFAVIATTKFMKTKPLKLRLPFYNIRNHIDRHLIFSGYPSNLPLLTVRGTVAGFTEDTLIMHSAAWLGSSGSNVFDNSGNFIGILYGVSMGQFAGIPTLMEDYIWVAPCYVLDWDAINKAIKEKG